MSTSVAPASSGLFAASGATVPLEGVSVETRIRDYAATTVVAQRYRNAEAQPIEAVYKFPLDEGAAVCGFEIEIGGRRLVGRVEEREKAFQVYDDAMAEGHGAYLLDEERADVFTLSVGNVPAGETVVVRLTTVATLPLEGEDISYTLPTTISPRYAPQADRTGVGIPEAERVNPTFARSVPYGLQLTVDVEMSAAVRGVESPTHPVAIAVDGRRATVRLSSREAAMDRDFVLRIGLAETHQPRAIVERAPDGAAYTLLSFRPRFEKRPARSEIVFLVDRSGSMEGTSIAEAKNALQLCLRSLPAGCSFNLVGFGSEFEPLFPESRPYDDASLRDAVAHIEALDADMGGTELLPALEFVLRAKPVEGFARQLFVITDGEVSNTDEVIALARQHASRARVFSFGVGAGASHHLVKGLARAGEGEAEFIAPGERMEAKVVRQLERALSPVLTNVAVDWAGLAAEQAPHRVPPVFDGGRVLVFGKLEKLEAATVALRAKGATGEVRFELPLDPSQATDGSLLATLWARTRIRDLEEGASELHVGRGSRQKRGKSVEDRAKDEVIRLGKQYGLASRHTSYVAVEERPDGTPGEVLLRKVPSAITHGWHGGVVMLEDRPVFDRDAPELMADASREFDAAPPPTRAGKLLRQLAGGAGMRAVALPPSSRPPATPPPAQPSVRPLDQLIALQSADGSWPLTSELARLTGAPAAQATAELQQWLARVRAARDAALAAREALRQASDAAQALRHPEIVQALEQALLRAEETVSGLESLLTAADPQVASRAIATAAALRWLESSCADTEGEWRMAAAKATQWLAQNRPPLLDEIEADVFSARG